MEPHWDFLKKTHGTKNKIASQTNRGTMVQTSSDKPWNQITMEPKTMEPKTMEPKNHGT